MSSRQLRASSRLLGTTGEAAASVIAARMLAFSNPRDAWSPWHQAELRRMTLEKCNAAMDGARAAGMEMAMMPGRMLLLAMHPASWTPTGLMDASMRMAGLWAGVGNAALRPASTKATSNRKRLARARRR